MDQNESIYTQLILSLATLVTGAIFAYQIFTSNDTEAGTFMGDRGSTKIVFDDGQGSVLVRQGDKTLDFPVVIEQISQAPAVYKISGKNFPISLTLAGHIHSPVFICNQCRIYPDLRLPPTWQLTKS